VTVTGLGILSAFGASREGFREALLRGERGIAPVTAFDVSRCRTRAAIPVKGIDPTQWIPAMKLRRLDRTGVFALAAVLEALADAGLDAGTDRDESGVVVGTFSAGGEATQDYLRRLHDSGPSGAPALIFHSTVGNAAASLAGLECKLRGPNVTVSQKEASGLAAIGVAVDLLRESRADLVVAGGVDAISEMFFRAHDLFDVMSPGDADQVRSAPFDRRRNGFLLGEGGFMLPLERADGRRAPARTYGQVLGVGSSSAAVPVNAWPDSPLSIVRAMQMAMADAEVGAGDVDVVFASANSTRELDQVEADAIRMTFGGRPLVTSVKGSLGESGSSGAAACATALLCGQHGLVPPIAGLEDADACASGLRLVSVRTPLPGPVLLVNGVGSGGSLVSVILRAEPGSPS
jgi:3-oxoacyl-[acyl-carrier-protein] synthase II